MSALGRRGAVSLDPTPLANLSRHDTGPAGRIGICALAFLHAASPLGCRPSESAPRAGSSLSHGEGEGASAPLFSEITAEAGLDFVHVNGMSGRLYFVEMMGAGGALFDYDNDGDLDIYAVQGHALEPGRPPDSALVDQLYRNDLQVRPDGTRSLSFTNVTRESGLRAAGYGMGAATGDYNNDGWVDLYVLNWGRNQLWRNNGDGTFTDVTDESGSDDPRWSVGASFLDFDLDGWLDLVVINYNRYTWDAERPCYAQSGRREYCGPHSYSPEQDRLFRNRADGTFADVTLEMGLADAYGPALGVVVADFDLDGWPDIYVANDQSENFLWMNRAGQRFENVAVPAGAAVNAYGEAEASMGVNAADFDGDGDEDLFMTHLDGETNTLFLNLGDALFEDHTRASGLGAPSRVFTGFGVAPIDYDNDGWLDLFIANGAVNIIPEQADRGNDPPLRQTNQLFRNSGNGRFEDVTPRGDGIFDVPHVGRGVAYGDIDNDGDMDLLVLNNNGPARLLRNEVGHSRHWLGLRLIGGPGLRGEGGGRDMLGARVAVVRPDGSTLWRGVQAAGSYASSHDPRVLIGLGDDPRYRTIRVEWPGRQVEEWEGLAVDRYHTLVQGDGRTMARR